MLSNKRIDTISITYYTLENITTDILNRVYAGSTELYSALLLPKS